MDIYWDEYAIFSHSWPKNGLQWRKPIHKCLTTVTQWMRWTQFTLIFMQRHTVEYLNFASYQWTKKKKRRKMWWAIDDFATNNWVYKNSRHGNSDKKLNTNRHRLCRNVTAWISKCTLNGPGHKYHKLEHLICQNINIQQDTDHKAMEWISIRSSGPPECQYVFCVVCYFTR